jgi:hypothetical protein
MQRLPELSKNPNLLLKRRHFDKPVIRGWLVTVELSPVSRHTRLHLIFDMASDKLILPFPKEAAVAVKCEIQFPDNDQIIEAELSFDIPRNERPQVIYNYQIGYLEHPRGDKVYKEKACKTLWFSICKTK